MKKMDHVSQADAGSLLHSISAIKEAHNQLDLLTSSSATATALASQIQLCDVLLYEISGVRSRLAKHLKTRRTTVPDAREHVGLNH